MEQLWRKLFSIMLVTAGVLTLLVAGDSKVARGNGVASDFEGIDIICEGERFVISADDRIAGRSEAESTVSDTGLFRIVAKYFPDVYHESEWIAPGHTALVSNAPVNHRGYAMGGQLDGYRIIFTAEIIASPDDSVISECDGDTFLLAVQLVGKIIAPPRNN